MSELRNQVEDLEREEVRSEENSVASSQLREFMVPDNAYSGGVDSQDLGGQEGQGGRVELNPPTGEALEQDHGVTQQLNDDN